VRDGHGPGARRHVADNDALGCVWYTKRWYMAACAETRVHWDHGRAKRLEALKKLGGCRRRACIVLRHRVGLGAGQVCHGGAPSFLVNSLLPGSLCTMSSQAS
jgi:hypothetical protein